MTVIDIRNLMANSAIELVEVGDETIYYAEEKLEEGLNSLFLLSYDRAARREHIVANYILSDPSYRRHCFAFPQDLLLVMENGGGTAWILRLEKETGREKNFALLRLPGSFAGCLALDAGHLLFYAGPDGDPGGLFAEYQRLTGYRHAVCLYDIENGWYYYVKDARVCNGAAGQVLPCALGGEDCLQFLDPCCPEAEKERLFLEGNPSGRESCDRIWKCTLADFLACAKASRAEFPLELLFHAGTRGMVRYACADDENLYFFAEYFPRRDRRICALDRATGQKTIAAVLEDSPPGSSLFFDRAAGKIYRLWEEGGARHVQGVLHSSVDASYNSEWGDFVSCVEDRFLLLRYILSDEKDSFEFHSIYDCESGEQQSYERRCAVRGDTVVLY